MGFTSVLVFVLVPRFAFIGRLEVTVLLNVTLFPIAYCFVG